MKNTFCILFLIFSISSFAQEAAFDETQELTLDEEQAAENYIHQGIASNRSFEMCENGVEGFEDICTESNYAFSGGFGRTLEAMIPAVTKAYSLIITATSPKLKKISTVNGEQVTESKTDFCQYIAVAGETISIGLAQLQNAQTQENFIASKPEARQAAAFYSLAKNHKDQAKASKIQMGIWGATAGCYAALLATGVVSGDWQLYAKAGGSALIAVFYKKKVDVHKKRARLLEEMAKRLPQAGDCNPFTATSCFCNEETSFSADTPNYLKFCVPKPLVARNQTNDAVSCVDAQRALDPTCNCVAQNNCLNRVLKTGALNFGIAPTIVRDPLAGLNPVSQGFGTGDLDAVTDRNLSAVNGALKNFKPTDIGDLTNSQKDVAKTIVGAGIPAGVAATIAKRGASSALPGSFSGGLASGDLVASVPNQNGALRNRNTRSNYKSGKSAKRSGTTRSSGPFSRLQSKKGINKGGVEVDNGFAIRAQREAEIVKDPGVNIFQVINNRYQTSAWREFPEALVNED